MRLLLDENLPQGLRRLLAPRVVLTAQQAGLASFKNGQLLAPAEGRFDILLTVDKNLRYQQNLSGRKLAIVELPTNRWPFLRLLHAQILEAVDAYQPGTYAVIDAHAK